MVENKIGVLLVIAAVQCLFYARLIMHFFKGWNYMSIFYPENSKQAKAKAVSDTSRWMVVVPFRNEAHHLRLLTQQLLSQNASSDLVFCFVDDHSTDNSLEVLAEFNDPRMRVLRLGDDRSGKKAAITFAIEQSDADWILTTDADCERGANWVFTMRTYASEHRSDFISGPVVMKTDHPNVLDSFQSLDFLSLNAIGAACIGQKTPTVCNGANLAYKRSMFIALDGFSDNEHKASGDDEFLLHKAHENGYRLGFVKSKDAIVSTRPEPNLSAFFHQRKRWVSKSTHYTRRWITAVLAMTWIFLAMQLACFVIGCLRLDLVLTLIGFGMFAFRAMCNFVFIRTTARFYGLESYVRFLPFTEVFYVFYALIIGIAGNFGQYSWKDRKWR
jgi:cellulose synthase/poly-beta-1,6-N-acetylglucosamine synthase-like glycosyltransferase